MFRTDQIDHGRGILVILLLLIIILFVVEHTTYIDTIHRIYICGVFSPTGEIHSAYFCRTLGVTIKGLKTCKDTKCAHHGSPLN